MLYKRFFYFEISEELSEEWYKSKLFLCRNYLVFNSVLNDQELKTSVKSCCIVDVGKEIDITKAFDYFHILFNPISICWLDEGELSRVGDFCLLFSDIYHCYSKGRFLQDYLERVNYGQDN